MVIGFDGLTDIVAAQEKYAHRLCRDLGAKDLGEDLGQQWWEHRYDFYFPPKALEFPWMFGTLDTVTHLQQFEKLDR